MYGSHMQEAATPATSTRSLERVLAIVGALVCLAVSVHVWNALPPRQPRWPLPGLYVVEMLVVSALGAFGLLRGDSRASQVGAALAWGAIGALAAFSWMAAWSVGVFFMPVLVILLASAVLRDRRRHQGMARHVGIGVAAALAQLALMLVVISLLDP